MPPSSFCAPPPPIHVSPCPPLLSTPFVFTQLPHFCGKGVCMCHHWCEALPCFTPLPGLHPLPPAGAPLLPCLCGEGAFTCDPIFVQPLPPLACLPHWCTALCLLHPFSLLHSSPPFSKCGSPIDTCAPFSVPTVSTCKFFM